MSRHFTAMTRDRVLEERHKLRRLVSVEKLLVIPEGKDDILCGLCDEVIVTDLIWIANQTPFCSACRRGAINVQL